MGGKKKKGDDEKNLKRRVRARYSKLKKKAV